MKYILLIATFVSLGLGYYLSIDEKVVDSPTLENTRQSVKSKSESNSENLSDTSRNTLKSERTDNEVSSTETENNTPDLDELLNQYKELQALLESSSACEKYPLEKILCLQSVYENLKSLFEDENSELSRSGQLGLSALNEVQVQVCTKGAIAYSQICHDLVLDLKESSIGKSKLALRGACDTSNRGCSALASILKKDGKSSDQELGVLYQKGCSVGEFFSCHDGAKIYKQLGDLSSSFALFKKSCFLGNSIGCLEALEFDEELDKTTKSFALNNLETHCKDQKHVHSCRKLSKIFLKEKSYENYYRVLKNQCEFGDSDACVSYLNFLIEDSPDEVVKFKNKICTWYRNFENNIDEKTTSSLKNFTCSQAQRCIANDDLSEFPSICYGDNG